MRFFLLLIAPFLVSCAPGLLIKGPDVAGTYYPADPTELRQVLNDYLDKARPAESEDGRLLAIQAPHAAYSYSGQIAAHGFTRLRGIDTAIIIAWSHHSKFVGASVFAKGQFKTPLGTIPVDEALAARLLKPEANVFFSPGLYAKEYAIELQIPFLQVALENFRIVPILLGTPTQEMYAHLSKTLAQALEENPRAVIVASVDLSHYHDYETAKRLDGVALEALRGLSLVEAMEGNTSGKSEVEGPQTTYLTLMALKMLGANEARLYSFGNSGDVTGKLDSVVGYASFGFFRNPLTPEDKRELLTIARTAAKAAGAGDKIERSGTDNPRLKTEAGAIVTIRKNGKVLRESGAVRTSLSLYESVIRNSEKSVLAAEGGAPLRPDELEGAEMEIAVLSRFWPIDDIGDFTPGLHGIYVSNERGSAYIMPDIAAKNGWDARETIRRVLREMDLEEEDMGYVEAYRFEVERFGESELGKP